MPKISVIVPCLNEEAVLPQLFTRLTAAAATWEAEVEFICVDDGSSDRTWQLLRDQYRLDQRWLGLSFARNFGHQTAVSAGLWHATGDAVVVLDADLQDPPEEIARLLEPWRAGYEVVYGIRQKRQEDGFKRLAYWTFYRLLSRFAAFEVPLDAGDFCVMSRRVVATINAMPERNRFVRGLRAWSGFRQIGVTYDRAARQAGTPKYGFYQLVKLATDGLFAFSTAPLRLATYLGLGVSACAFLGAVFTFFQKIFAAQFARIGLAPQPGFPTIVISVLFLGGVQLICLGILGEYIGRIYEEVKGRPRWIIRDTAGLTPASDAVGLPRPGL
jgi:dolichol-phosphate mannosyltransferase